MRIQQENPLQHNAHKVNSFTIEITANTHTETEQTRKMPSTKPQFFSTNGSANTPAPMAVLANVKIEPRTEPVNQTQRTMNDNKR